MLFRFHAQIVCTVIILALLPDCHDSNGHRRESLSKSDTSIKVQDSGGTQHSGILKLTQENVPSAVVSEEARR